MTEMKIKAIAPWFGGKRTLAPEIVKELGKHTQYFEPFCGSMAVLFAKEPSQKETVNDLHGDLVNLARVIAFQSSAEILYDRLQRALLSDDLLEQAKVILSNVDDLELYLQDLNHLEPMNLACIDRAYWYFLASWMGRNGTAGTRRVDYQLAVRWTKGGGSSTVRWKNAVNSLPWWHQRLQNVAILNRDAFRILDRFEDVDGTAIYCDPPYYADTRTNHDKTCGSGAYLHEFEHGKKEGEKNHHEELAKILREYQHARIVVSYYDCPQVRELYDGWTFVEKTMNKHLHAQAGRGARKKVAPEVLIINGPSYTEGERGSLF